MNDSIARRQLPGGLWEARTGEQILDWAREVGLISGLCEEERLTAMRLGAFAALIVPQAAAVDTELTAQWAAFVCLVDDQLDRSEFGTRPDEVGAMFGRLLGVLTEDGPVRHETGVEAALADLWRRTAPRMSAAWRARFVADYRDFAQATRREAEARRDHVRLSLDDYLVQRRSTITALPMADIVECTADASWPGLLPRETRVRALRLAAADVAGWTNDLASAATDLHRGQDNLLSVLAREHRCSADQARKQAVSMRDNRLRDFHLLATELAEGVDVPPGEREQVRRCVAALGCFVEATLHWLHGTGRFETRWLPDST
ncbi:terpene synthase family protein [Kitasatospora sp. GP82]|uniref:terpene synthase family protein n=1 Tax=Kitasatospora sp. GP82 TaxID=3035089 RepID=UPI00247588D5|nr:terpene synthase family protein [Kitasatospora sp. GP82]MDH6128327.1 hypothetical protein [Kitasatospora sp. GP82]